MNGYTTSLDGFAGSYLKKRRVKRLKIGLVAFVAAAAAAWIVFILARPGFEGNTIKYASVQEISALWESGSYDKVEEHCVIALSHRPLDPAYLKYRGYAAFYLALRELDEATRLRRIEDCVIALRKILALGGDRSLAQVEYVLGRAYYYRGPFFMDECAAHLESAERAGAAASDIDQYLALAYANLGDSERSLERFEKALAVRKTDALLLAAASQFKTAGKMERAELLAQDARDSSTDAVVRERARFLLAEILRERKDFTRAESELDGALADNPDSSEAHYLLGLLFAEQGDTVRARAEWRKALSLDPTNAAARQKLTERS